MQAPSSLARASVPYLPPSSSNTRPGRAPDGAFASLQVLLFSVGAVPDSLSARIGPFSGPIQAFSAIFARIGPRFGPVLALWFRLDP